MDLPQELIHGNSAQMSVLADACADLILTGPPYFPDEVEHHLRAGVTEKDDLDALELSIQSYAWSLRAVFEECNRILRPGGKFIIQTRDVRLRHILVGVEGIHRQIIESLGINLFAKHIWKPAFINLARRRISTSLNSYGPMPFDPEVFLVFLKPGNHHSVLSTQEDIDLLNSDVMITTSGVLKAPHRFQAPLPVISSLVRCHSSEGDLVVDPFAGGGTILLVAKQLKRRSIGYEIDAEMIKLAKINLGGEAI
jgi:DNA modification methylase